MSVSKSMLVGRDLGELGRTADHLRHLLNDVVDEYSLSCIELAFVEALTNSILHGPPDTDTPIAVFVEILDTQVVVEIEDGSPPMPTLFDNAGAHRLEFDIKDIENLPESGRGLSLIAISMDEVTFRVIEDRIRLRMVRYRRQ